MSRSVRSKLPMRQSLHLHSIPEPQRLAFYGALLTLANSDGETDRKELQLVFEILDTEGLSNSGIELLHTWLITPPSLDLCLGTLADSPLEFRHGMMFAMLDLAIVDGRITPEEEEILLAAQQRLGISDSQRRAIADFSLAAQRVAARGKDDPVAAQAMRNASAGLTAVGVPLTALYFSGSVVGLSAAGITSGLAALGLGLGMVPGIGLIVVLSVATFYGVKKLFGASQAKATREDAISRERTAQMVIHRLQDAITSLQKRIAELEATVADAEATREALQVLMQRIEQLQQSIRTRRASAA
jgi:uncharacterized tellurite resistance protein B-like protein